MFYITEFIADGSFIHCGNRDFQHFCSCDLDLDPMTFTDELERYSQEIYWMCENKLSASRQTRLKLHTRRFLASGQISECKGELLWIKLDDRQNFTRDARQSVILVCSPIKVCNPRETLWSSKEENVWGVWKRTVFSRRCRVLCSLCKYFNSRVYSHSQCSADQPEPRTRGGELTG